MFVWADLVWHCCLILILLSFLERVTSFKPQIQTQSLIMVRIGDEMLAQNTANSYLGRKCVIIIQCGWVLLMFQQNLTALSKGNHSENYTLFTLLTRFTIPSQTQDRSNHYLLPRAFFICLVPAMIFAEKSAQESTYIRRWGISRNKMFPADSPNWWNAFSGAMWGPWHSFSSNSLALPSKSAPAFLLLFSWVVRGVRPRLFYPSFNSDLTFSHRNLTWVSSANKPG